MTLSDDTARLLADVALAVIGIALAAWLIPRQLRVVGQLGGRPVARAVVVAAVVLLALSLQPELFGVENGLLLTILALFLVFRPEAVVQLSGGPSVEWRALAEGMQLQRLVAVHTDRRSAQHLPDVRAHLAALAAADSPATSRYIELIQATIFADPESPGMADRYAALAVEESRLRKLVGPRPAFDGGLVAVEEARPPRHAADDDAASDDADTADPADDA